MFATSFDCQLFGEKNSEDVIRGGSRILGVGGGGGGGGGGRVICEGGAGMPTASEGVHGYVGGGGGGGGGGSPD